MALRQIWSKILQPAEESQEEPGGGRRPSPTLPQESNDPRRLDGEGGLLAAHFCLSPYSVEVAPFFPQAWTPAGPSQVSSWLASQACGQGTHLPLPAFLS